MGKSEGNLIRLDMLDTKGVHPLAYRYFVLGAHYRTKLNFIWEAVRAADNALQKIYAEARELVAPKGKCINFEKKFNAAIDDDLNTPQALAVVWEMLKSSSPPAAKAASLLKFDKVLGLDIKKYLGKKIKAPKEVLELVKKREEARKKKDWKSADKLRAEIERMGFEIEDTKDGAKINSQFT